ncbi:MAG: division/cell wall cluster transcriptional repressor MraZ [Oscillospiraceae bacterium]|nr:division/cell wall cluster transcriptional repressor MraZ [Oscillospiraceae bacterium]
MPRTRGNAEGTIDQKRRVSVPARFSDIYPQGEEIVLWEPQGKEQPYLVLSLDEYFDEMFEREYAQSEKQGRQNLLRDAYGHVEYVELDSARRFVIPERYREKAGFDRGDKLFFLANRTYMEIWPLAVWRLWESNRRADTSRFDYTPDPARPIPQETSDDIPS